MAKAQPKSDDATPDAPEGGANAHSEGKERTCFVIGEIDSPDSEARRRFDGIVDHVIRPALRPLGFKVEDPHRNFDGGSITRRIIERLLQADLVIADLTGLNPNVMYELAVRHAKRLPVIQIMRAPLALPFDLKDDLTFEYVDDIRGAADLRNTIARAAQKAIETDEPPDNPIFRAARALNVDVSVEGEPGDFKQSVLDQLGDLQAGLAEMRQFLPTTHLPKPDYNPVAYSYIIRIKDPSGRSRYDDSIDILRDLGFYVASFRVNPESDIEYMEVKAYSTKIWSAEELSQALPNILSLRNKGITSSAQLLF